VFVVGIYGLVFLMMKLRTKATKKAKDWGDSRIQLGDTDLTISWAGQIAPLRFVFLTGPEWSNCWWPFGIVYMVVDGVN
jgi:hypothetical protein